MLKIHPTAIPIIIENDKQVGWRVESRDFTFDAIAQDDGTVNTYVEWGDDQGGDMANHENWSDTASHLDSLLQASQR